MRGRGIGPTGGFLPNGLLERLLVIGLGLLAVIAMEYTPLEKLRSGTDTGTAPLAAATAVSTPAPATAPPATVAPTATVAPLPTAAPAPAAEPPRPAPPNPPAYRVAAGGDGANLRSGPSRSASVVVSVRDGTELANLDEQQTADGLLWRRVASGNVDGWVAAELLTPVQ
jgi:hypothetical protein